MLIPQPFEKESKYRLTIYDLVKIKKISLNGLMLAVYRGIIAHIGHSVVNFAVIDRCRGIHSVGRKQLVLVGQYVHRGESQLSAEQIFTEYARHIGIGGIATAGIIGIIKSFGVIKSAVGLAAGEFSKKKAAGVTEEERTQRDISMKIVIFGIAITLIAVFLFFAFGVVDNIWHAVIGVLVVGIIAFLFTTVAANAIAIVGSNPVSGMTLMTLILASLVMVAAGLKGTAGMTAALIIGGVVCTALSVAGAFVTDLKIGYWIGSTPKKQESWKFLGTLVAAATVGGVMLVLNQTYGFTGENALVAPQANAMAAVIEPMMNGGSAPWLMYGIGAVIAIILTLFKVPALAFALGMFIPLDLNMPMLVGGAISWFVSTRSKDPEINNARNEKGTLIASGFIAGGALMGVISAILKFADVDWYMASSAWTEPVAIIPYILIVAYIIISSLRAGKADPVGFRFHRSCRYSSKVISRLTLAISTLSP